MVVAIGDLEMNLADFELVGMEIVD